MLKILGSTYGISVTVFALTLIVWALVMLKIIGKNKRKRLFTPGRILFVGTFISAFAYFIPIYAAKGIGSVATILNAFQHSFRIFALDGDFMSFVAETAFPEGIKELCLSYGALLYAFAPILTFGFILTFFKNFFAHLKYKLFFWGKTHVFSELNEKTLSLAKSIQRNSKPYFGFLPGALIVFTDIIEKKEELNLDLIEEASEIDAILFRKDLESVHFKRKGSSRKVNFYLISGDEQEKIRHAESIIRNYDDVNTNLWIFSDSIRTELMLAKNETSGIKVKRVNDIQMLVYHNLDKYGKNLFINSRDDENGEKVISVVIAGLGKYGTEMLKALVWYCQLKGYRLKINAFDTDIKARDKFVEKCPELMSLNKKYEEGEAYYEIDIHSGIDIAVPEFEEKLTLIDDATYIFVCLGDDETNLSASAKIRSICERTEYKGNGRKPDIETVIYDTNVSSKLKVTREALEDSNAQKQGAVNFKNEAYSILMTGDLESFYSEDIVIDSELSKAGYAIHAHYEVEAARISFTENFMIEEWNRFIKEEKLTDVWLKHYKKALKEKDPEKPLTLSIAKKAFTFMTSAEIAEQEKSLDPKNAAAVRADKWERMVYAKFAGLMENPVLAEIWAKKKKEQLAEAKKSFCIDYNYRSSIAKAIHKRLISKLPFMPGLTKKPWKALSLKEKIEIGKIEHVRWNAYMRAEGYRYAPVRNDLARVHHNLVPVSELSNDDLRKDA